MILANETPIGEIVVRDRHRKDMGDIDALASSIAELGLLQPVVIDVRGHLIAGYRRLAACKQLGLANVATLMIDGLDDALKALHAERDENTCRKEFSPSELVAMGRAIEEIERPKAKERQVAGLKQGDSRRDPGNTTGRSESNKTREAVGKALGISGPTFDRAKAVVVASENPDDPAHETAKELVKQMDEGSVTITRAADEVRTERRRAAARSITGGSDKTKAAVLARRETVRKLAASQHTIGQIAKQMGLNRDTVQKICKELDIETVDKNMPNQRRFDGNRVIETTTAELADRIETSLSLMEGRWSDVDPARVEGWVASLENSRQSLNRFLKFLKETTLV